jgi:hypothetical protein
MMRSILPSVMPSAERCPVRAIKEMSGTPTSRSDVLDRDGGLAGVGGERVAGLRGLRHAPRPSTGIGPYRAATSSPARTGRFPRSPRSV